MNQVINIGRLVRDPEVRTAHNGDPIVRITVAIDRTKDGNKITDFLDWTAFGKTAALIEKFFHRGEPIALTGRIQNNNYTDKEGKKVYQNQLVVDRVTFLPVSRSDRSDAPATVAPVDSSEFLSVPDAGDDGLPFN